MKLYIAGDGPREKELRSLCVRRGHTLPDHGPWDMVALPLPRSSIAEELADQLPPGQKVACGITDACFDRLAARRGWRLMRVLQDERYSLENAALTAEGAVSAAMNACPFALGHSRCLVIGYGRIGKRLAFLLRALGASVTVAARRAESRQEAGPGSVSIAEIPSVLPETDLIFNTVPAMILDRKALLLVSPSACLMELASKPYGMDLDAAKELGLRVLVEGGLPGRYCPQSAVMALLDCLERMNRHE